MNRLLPFCLLAVAMLVSLVMVSRADYPPMQAMPVHTHADANTGGIVSGYTLQFSATVQAVNPGDSTSYFPGDMCTTLGTFTFTNNALVVPKTGTLRAVHAKVFTATTLASNEAVSEYIDINAGTTVVTLTTSETWDVAVRDRFFTGLTQAVTAGDYICPKITTPTWVTNPQGTKILFTCFFTVP